MTSQLHTQLLTQSSDTTINIAPRWRRSILLPPDFPTIVCLIGSTRKALDAFRHSMLAETSAGRIVLSIGSVTQDNDELGVTEKKQAELDDLHMRKIDMADEVLVLNVDGYIGESTQRELNYALSKDKRVRFLEPVSVIEAGRVGPSPMPDPSYLYASSGLLGREPF